MERALLDSHYVKVLPYLFKGLGDTLIITICGLMLGFILGVLFGFLKLSHNKISYLLANIYIEIIRGSPLLVQILFIYFALPDVTGFNIERVPAAIIAIALNSGAYIAEIVRGAIQSIGKEQMEAGRSLGLTYLQTMTYIIWPQAVIRMIPPLGNQFIISLKDTSLFSVIAVQEFIFQARLYYSGNFAIFESLTMVSLIYLLITIPTSMYLKRLERKLSINN